MDQRILGKRRVIILLFHKVNRLAAPFFGEAVKPHVFEKQIRFLKRFYEIVDLAALTDCGMDLKTSRDLIVITFDDGYRDNYSYAFPILKKYGVPATIFLTTDYVGTHRLLWHDELAWILYKASRPADPRTAARLRLPPKIHLAVEQFFGSDLRGKVQSLHSLASLLKKFSDTERQGVLSSLANICGVEEWPGERNRPMLSWDEVSEMAEEGISFGSHSRTHPVLSRLSPLQAREEIIGSKKAIESKIGKPVTCFAYPYGKEEDYSRSTWQVLREGEFTHACTAIRGHEKFPIESSFALRRRGAPLRPLLFL